MEGYRVLERIQQDHLSWEFNEIRIVQDNETGKLGYGHDSGCSCPSPFEDYPTFKHYELITPANVDEIKEEIMSFPSEDGHGKKSMIELLDAHILEHYQ
jgi:hypothetical protein